MFAAAADQVRPRIEASRDNERLGGGTSAPDGGSHSAGRGADQPGMSSGGPMLDWRGSSVEEAIRNGPEAQENKNHVSVLLFGTPGCVHE